MKKKYIGLFVFAVAGLTAASFGAPAARADGTAPAVANCGLPVCDIPAALAALKSGTEGSRYAMISGLRASIKNSHDLAALNNVADFAKQAQATLAEVYPATDTAHAYVVREAVSLYGDVLMGLAKYSPLDAAKIGSYYAQIVGESARYEVITYWTARIAEFEDKDSLLQLLDLFGKMAAASNAAGDAAYLARATITAQDVITKRLVQLYPYYEGTYKISVHCDIAAGEDVPAYCNDGFINRLVIMDTMSSTGLQISLANTETSTMLYTFSNVVLSGGGATFEAQGSPSGVLSQLHVVLDRSAGTVSGFLRNSDSNSTVQIEGKLDASPSQVYDLSTRSTKQEPLVAANLVGTYKGLYAGRKASLSLVQFADGNFGGTMSFDEQPSFKLRFQASNLYPKMGVLVLVAHTSTGANVKLTAYFGRTDTGYRVQGFGFTDLSGATQLLDLTSVTQH